ncbi:MAG: hypothetical protein JWQ79_3493 [Mucilaginibacter sp.]|nr:hypothetical protein [Mucilaginibacter sp.]
MSQPSGFMPHRQIHVLVNMKNKDHNVTVLPGHEGNFRVIEQGEVLGEVNFTPQRKIICYKGRLKKALISQLEKHLSQYYSYAF